MSVEPSPPQLSVEPNPRVPIQIVQEEAHFVVICKPAGVVSQPGAGHERDSVLNGLFARYGKRLQNLGKARDYGLIHRLDRQTSGLMVVALANDAYDAIRGQFETRSVHKAYVMLVHGILRPPTGVDRTPIREVREGGRKIAKVGAHPRARSAVTEFETLAEGRKVSLVQCRIRTGRLHQIRAHMSLRRCPVVGDTIYGRRNDLDRAFLKAHKKALFLHAGELDFFDPSSGRRVRNRVPLSRELTEYLSTVEVRCPPRWRGH